jgi:hypothetical protein
LSNRIEKLEPKEFIKRFKELLLDKETNRILIRGYFDDDKLLLVFSCLYDLEEFNKGTVVIGNTTVPYERQFLEKGLHEVVPRFNLRDSFNVYGMIINFVQWKRNIDLPFGFDKDFALFHPVQSVLDGKDFPKFCGTIKNAKAKKNILITTNDFNNTAEKLYPYIDATLILDTTLNFKNKLATGLK